MQNLRNLSASERSVGIIGEAISKLVRNTAVLFGGFRAGLECLMEAKRERILKSHLFLILICKDRKDHNGFSFKSGKQTNSNCKSVTIKQITTSTWCVRQTLAIRYSRPSTLAWDPVYENVATLRPISSLVMLGPMCCPELRGCCLKTM